MNALRVALPFAPRAWQRPLLDCNAPRIVAVVHRRAGKSTALMWRGLRKALTWQRAHLPPERRNLRADPPRVVHVLPLQVQWQRTGLWDRLERAAADIPGAQAFRADRRIVLPNGGIYQAGGMDNPESWRGGYADEVIEDEADDVSAEGLDMVIEPMLADYRGVRVWSGTPKGNGRLQARYDEAGAGEGWARFLLDYRATGALDDEAIARLRARLSGEEFAQELECSFTAPNAGAYYSALLDTAEREGRICRVPHDPMLRVETWWDLGMDDATAIWFVQHLPHAGEIRVIDYLEASGEPLAYYAQQLQARGYTYSAHRLPHDVQVRELGSGKTRLETLRALGLAPIHPGKAMPVADGINAVKLILPRCYFDAERTVLGRKWLRRYRREWIEDREVWSSKPVHDASSHAADAFREGASNMRDLPKAVRPWSDKPPPQYSPLAW